MAKYEPYPSDLNEKEWRLISGFIPRPQKRRRPPQYSKKEIINAIFYLVRSGCTWRMLPKEMPSWRLVYYYYARWQKEGVWQKIQDYLRCRVREKHAKKKPRVLRSSTARVLRHLPSPECEATMREKRSWDESDTFWWIPLG